MKRNSMGQAIILVILGAVLLLGPAAAAFAGAEAFIRAGRFRSGDVIEGEVVDEHYDERPTPGRTVLP